MISVIIPTCHRNELLAKCLDRLAPGNQILAFDHYEVIVTDDGPQSNAAAMIAEQYPWVKWVVGHKRGPAANRNNGAKYAKGDWLVFTDDDCLPNPHWLEAYFEAIQELFEIKVFEGRTYADRERRRLDEESPVNETGGYLWSCNFAIKNDTFWKIGAFDEDFPFAAMEDVDLYYRIKKAGLSTHFVKEASICHPWRIINRWNKFQEKEKSIKFYLNKHPEEKKRLDWLYFLRAIKNHLALLIKINPLHYDQQEKKYFLFKQIFLIKMIFLRYL